jgi:hypothetical protein
MAFRSAQAVWFCLCSRLPAPLTRYVMSLHARFGIHFADRLLIEVFSPLIREFGIAFAGLDGRVSEQFFDGDLLGSRFQEVGCKSMAQTVTARLDACRLGIALDFFCIPLDDSARSGRF